MKRVLVAVLVVSFIIAGLVSPGCSSGSGEGAGVSTPKTSSYGPYVIDIGTSQGNQDIYLSTGQRVEFNFHSSGSLVYYKALDPNGNIILTGAGGDKVQDGSGSFTASGSGSYAIQFISSGMLTPSVITVYYTVYG
jgi:hypothetical protein